MDTVTGPKWLYLLLAQVELGLFKNMSIKAHADQIRFVKKHESGVIKEPLTASPEMTVDEIYGITKI